MFGFIIRCVITNYACQCRDVVLFTLILNSVCNEVHLVLYSSSS